MKVALIAPPYPLEENPSPHLGICYAAAAFEAAGNEVRILDYIVRQYTPEKLKEELDLFKPDIVGTNSVTMNFQAAASILQTAKYHMPDLITLMGGPHVTFDYKNTLKEYPEIDIIVIGEGEKTIQEIIPVITNRKKWRHIKGIAFEDNGEVVYTGKREFIQNLDTLSLPARHLLPISRYQAMGVSISIITSRGCPNQCIFCQGRRMVGKKVRYRDPALIVDEIEQILGYGFKRINIADDFFTANKNRVKLVCNEIIKRDIRFVWSAFARVDSVDAETLKIMMEAGCVSVSFGIESGNPEMLKRIKKRITLDQARKAAEICKQLGIAVFASFMIGLPGETRETLKDTHNFANELGFGYGYHFLAPFPGTSLMENIHEYDLEVLTDDWSLYDANQAIVRTSELSPEDIEEFFSKYLLMAQDEEKKLIHRYRKKICTDQERSRYEYQKKREIVFKLLSEDIIENHALCSIRYNEDPPVSQLSEKLSAILIDEKDIVKNTIVQLVEKG